MANSALDQASLSAHSMSSNAVLERLASSMESGLSETIAAQRLAEYGKNSFPHQQEYSAWRAFVRQFGDPQMFVLLGAAALSAGLSLSRQHAGFPAEAAFIATVALINASLGFAQEHRAHRAMEALRQLTPVLATVLRGGHSQVIAAELVVPGDIVLLYEGCIVPADGRVLESTSLSVIEAALTGESGVVPKETKEVGIEAPVAEMSCMVFNGTAVASGSGRAVVTATGEWTELGKIAALVQVTPEPKTPLQKKVGAISKYLAIAVGLLAIVFSGVFLVLSHARGSAEIANVILFSVALAVAASPEALATILTLALALAAGRLSREGAIVRRMNAIETLGSSTILLCDKTGTLTMNSLAVQDVFPASMIAAENTDAYDSEQERLLQAMALASIDQEGILNASFAGGRDAVNQAMWLYAKERRPEQEDTVSHVNVVRIIPFTSERKLMSVLVSSGEQSGESRLYVKGAPEVILDDCNWITTADRRLVPAERQQLGSYASSLASKGLKVMAIAVGNHPTDSLDTNPETGLTFLGLVTLSDPVRVEAEPTIQQAASAGIRTVLITGDHPASAQAIARKIGLPNAERVLSGKDIDGMDDQAVSRALRSCNVLARVTPSHKLRVAGLLQAAGEVVAMTGDGVNDAPALKKADVGIALGGGTDLAKQSADVVLTDDNIATIFRAIQEGRLVLENLRKAAVYLFTSNLSEVLTLSAIVTYSFSHSSSGNLTLPLRTEQILWINLITDTAPALALSLSKSENTEGHGLLAAGTKQLLDRRTMLQVFLYACTMTGAALLARLLLPYVSQAHAQTITVTTLVFAQLVFAQTWFALALDSRTGTIFQTFHISRYLLLATVGVFAAQTAIPQTAMGQRITGMTPLTLHDWATCLALSFVPFLLNELTKFRRSWTSPPRQMLKHYSHIRQKPSKRLRGSETECTQNTGTTD